VTGEDDIARFDSRRYIKGTDEFLGNAKSIGDHVFSRECPHKSGDPLGGFLTFFPDVAALSL
jgi:hypothetical protein